MTEQNPRFDLLGSVVRKVRINEKAAQCQTR
jgi:hypothetical protein